MCFSVVFDEILGRPQKDSPTTSAPTVTELYAFFTAKMYFLI